MRRLEAPMEMNRFGIELVARAQLDFVHELFNRFASRDSVARPVVEYESQYVAIVVLLRSVGHVFEKVDCVSAERRRWCSENWQVWKRASIFNDFIEPARNRLLKEFRGELGLSGDVFRDAAVVADPGARGGATRVISLEVDQLRDQSGNQVIPQLRSALSFWDDCLRQAEVAFAAMDGSA